MCFHTRDAVERDESTFTFRMPSGRLRTAATKVALASCEFPMVQWTVEESWDRLYTNEGILLTPDDNVLWVVAGDMRAPTSVCLPPRTNRVSVTRRGDRILVACDHPHGLWSADGSVNRAVFHLPGGVCLLGGSAGDVVLDASTLSWVNDREFEVAQGGATPSATTGAHTLFTPTIPSPESFATVLSHAARGCLPDDVRVSFRYDAGADRMITTITCPPETTGMVRLLNSALLRRLGISSMPVTLTGQTSVIVPSEATALWEYVTLPKGFYAPCHRPMCTGQPMRFGTEVETAINRLYFPIVKQGEAEHQLVFSDPDGRVYTAVIPAGRYVPASLANHLETAMTTAGGDGTVFTYSVSHEDDRFVLACERREHGGRISPAPFGLLFHHPLCIDAGRLGFPSQPLSGSDTYVATTTTRCTTTGNIVRVSEIAHQKRFRFHVTAPPPMVAEVLEQQQSDGCLVLRTHVNRCPFAHGYRAGDVVLLATCGAATVLTDTKERTLTACGSDVPHRCRCLVANGNNDDVTVLRLVCPPVSGLGEPGSALQVTTVAEPWNVCTGVHEGSIPCHLLGLKQGATQWGVDGSIGDAEGRLLPPFDAPHTHCLDHPDYVLMTFSESSGAQLEHSFDNENKQVFCKLSLYPLFREERMLPRDTTLMHSNMSTFDIAFWNPDMRTPYCFHGSEFSFSLSFISTATDGS